MIFSSKFPQKYFYFPQGYIPQEGVFLLCSLDGKKLLVDKESIQPYEISHNEAQKHLYKELNQSINQFINVVKSKTGQTGAEKAQEKNYLDPQYLFSKAKEGTEFLGDIAAAIKAMWEMRKSEDEATTAQSKEKMQEIRGRLKAKGIHLNENFEEIFEKLQKEQPEKEGEIGFKESAAKFEEELQRLKGVFTGYFGKKEETK
jgi:hypothetical protein